MFMVPLREQDLKVKFRQPDCPVVHFLPDMSSVCGGQREETSAIPSFIYSTDTCRAVTDARQTP